MHLNYIHVPGRRDSSLLGTLDPRAFPSTIRSPEDRAWPAVDVLISPWQKTFTVNLNANAKFDVLSLALPSSLVWETFFSCIFWRCPAKNMCMSALGLSAITRPAGISHHHVCMDSSMVLRIEMWISLALHLLRRRIEKVVYVVLA
jgi:hypothetical protein